MKRNIFECFFTEANHPYAIKAIFSTLGSIIEISSNLTGCQIASTRNDSRRDFLGLKPVIIQKEYNISDYPVDILPFDNIFLATDIGQ